jgi:mono/diheme cytochrome c family protein
MFRAVLGLVLLAVASPSEAVADGLGAGRRVDFAQDVRPILAQRCYACHGPDQHKGGLRLDGKLKALQGGNSGPAIVPGKSGESLLVDLVAGLDEGQVMPPKGPRLTPEQVDTLRRWIDQGASWPGSESDEDERDWWSLRPLRRPALPSISPEDAVASRNPIDVFIRAKLQEKGLGPSPEADRRTLVRRLYFDLIGLPPMPDEIDAFVNDPAPDAYERLVDRLLADPRHGERWARHWLDVVHYGDTHGYDKDQPRPNAWPYRDYVIRAFNADKPYGQFVREQVAGDVFAPDTTDGITAMGFIAAGPWDLIGHAEVPETKIDGQVARHLDRDDMVSNTINTFLSLTVQCAQCHNHKFDPIRQEEYYRLQAVFAALDRADRPYPTDPEAARQSADLKARRNTLTARRRDLEAALSKAGGPALAELDRRIDAASRPASPRPEFGYHSGIEAKQQTAKWVQVDLGQSSSLGRVVLWPCHDDFNGIGAGFGFPLRFKVEVSDDPAFRSGVVCIADRTEADVSNPGIAPLWFPARDARGRYVRVTAAKLAPRQNDFIFALAELEAFNTAGTNLARGGKVASLDTIDAPPRWQGANLVDGHAPGQAATSDLSRLRQERQALLERISAPGMIRAMTEVDQALKVVDAALEKLRPTGLVYAGTIHNGGSGSAFRGTGPDGGKPRKIHVLRRGDVRHPGPEVGPGALHVLAELPGDLALSDGHAEGDRRAALARWLTDERNALTWRSIVNRIWQYHFGRGIVATANDFGRMGQLPTHPELLEWLAVEFRDGGRSLKALHRLIVTSATYRQTSSGNKHAEALDAGNAYLWRMNRRKLEAEAVHDAALLACGKLDARLYGPAYRDFAVEHPEHSPHYEYELQAPDDPRIFRRAIYRFLVRSRPQPFMTVLDCADPSMQVEKRNETVSPLQALALYNNAFMLTMARDLAERVEGSGGPAEQVTAAFRLAIGRLPSGEERGALADYASRFGLANACRVILNLNEFMFVD